MVIKNKSKQKEYANLSVAISKNKALGKDVSKLVSERDKLVNKSISKKVILEFKNQELIYTIWEEVKQIKKLLMENSTQANLHENLREKISLQNVNAQSAADNTLTNKRVSLKIDKKFIDANYWNSYPSFSHYLRTALLAYQNQQIQPRLNYQPQNLIKKSFRLSREIESIYNSLPAGKKYLTLNQILASFENA